MDIKGYEQELRERELAESTQKLYLRAVKESLKYLSNDKITKEVLIEYEKKNS